MKLLIVGDSGLVRWAAVSSCPARVPACILGSQPCFVKKQGCQLHLATGCLARCVKQHSLCSFCVMHAACCMLLVAASWSCSHRGPASCPGSILEQSVLCCTVPGFKQLWPKCQCPSTGGAMSIGQPGAARDVLHSACLAGLAAQARRSKQAGPAEA